MKKLKTHLAVIVALLILIAITGCSSSNAADTINGASATLKSSENHTMKLTLSIKTNYENNSEDSMYVDSVVTRTLETKYQKAPTPGTSNLDGSKMSVFTYTSIDGSISRFYFYIKDNILYAQMIDESEDYISIPIDSPDYNKLATPASSLTALNFLIGNVSAEEISVEKESIRYNNESIDVKGYIVNLTDSQTRDLSSLLYSTLENAAENESELFNMLDFEKMDYKAIIDKNDNIIRFEIRYTVNMPSPAGDSTNVKTEVYILADIYDVNSTTVEYPDLSNAIGYSDMN